jgi:hypothetical protein
MADGNDLDHDRLEILDQRIRATYELRNCPAPAGQQKCRVAAELPLEKGKRIKLCVHVFRESVGGATAANVTKQNVRLRTRKWFRRAYAQVNMAPKFVPCRVGDSEIEFIDPPADNMITISQEHGLPVSATGGPYWLSFRLGLERPGDVHIAELAAVAAGLTAADAQPNVRVNLTNGWTPKQVAEAIVRAVGALAGGIFRAESFRNARAFTAINPSYDVLIKRNDNLRVFIRTPILALGAGISIHVAHVDTTNVKGNLPANWVVLNPELRRLVREAPGTDDRLDFYICREFTGFGGLGLNPHTDLPAIYRWDSPMRYACFVMARGFMDGTDNWPWAYPHEAGHVLSDAIHIDNTSVHASTCLMWSHVLSQQHPVDASKRILGHPVNVRYECWDPAAIPYGSHLVIGNLAERFRNRSGSVTEGW